MVRLSEPRVLFFANCLRVHRHSSSGISPSQVFCCSPLSLFRLLQFTEGKAEASDEASDIWEEYKVLKKFSISSKILFGSSSYWFSFVFNQTICFLSYVCFSKFIKYLLFLLLCSYHLALLLTIAPFVLC